MTIESGMHEPMAWTLDPDDPVLTTPAVWHPEAPREGWSVVWFQHTIEVGQTIQDAVLRLSASQRFELFVDDQRIARGPSRTDPDRWGVMTVALPALPPGPHTLRVRVWHAGKHSAMTQMGPPAFLLVHSDHPALADWTTGDHWRCRHDTSRTPLAKHAWGERRPYDVVGSGESIDLATPQEGWRAVKVIAKTAEDPWGNLPLACRLRPDPLPQMHEADRDWQRVAQADDSIADAAQAWLELGQPLQIEADREARVVLDQGTIVNAYLTFSMAGGRGAQIEIVTAEAPSLDDWSEKPPRDQTQGVRYRGHRDMILPDGGDHTVDLCWFRSFRYLELRIRTAEQPLTIHRIGAAATAFPLPPSVHSEIHGEGLPDMPRVLAACDRTIELCAHELLFDCPHYEQCQFPGDARLQALYHYAIHGEPRLGLKAIDDFHASRRPDGMLECRWPSTKRQLLPTFALQWIGMLHDAMRWLPAAHLHRYLPVAAGVLQCFLERRRSDGLVGFIPNAPFIDWSPGFEKGNAPQDADGGSAIVSLMLARACQELDELQQRLAPDMHHGAWASASTLLLSEVRAQCWDDARQLVADTPSKQTFSVHGQCEAAKAGLVSVEEAGGLLLRALEDPDITRPGSFYYWHYVFQTSGIARQPNVIVDALPMWEDVLDRHRMDTLPETMWDSPRSDCHAWSSMPAYHLSTTLLGLSPVFAGDGERAVRFDPQPGRLNALEGSIPVGPHRITAALRRVDDQWQADIDSPVAVQLGHGSMLAPGKHRVTWPIAAGRVDGERTVVERR